MAERTVLLDATAEEVSLDVATSHRGSNACAVLSAFESAAATPQTPEEPTAEEWLDRCDTNDNGRVTCAEARAEACGAPIPVTKDHSLYQFMRDGDGDGRVCE